MCFTRLTVAVSTSGSLSEVLLLGELLSGITLGPFLLVDFLLLAARSVLLDEELLDSSLRGFFLRPLLADLARRDLLVCFLSTDSVGLLPLLDLLRPLRSESTESLPTFDVLRFLPSAPAGSLLTFLDVPRFLLEALFLLRFLSSLRSSESSVSVLNTSTFLC